MYSFAVTFKHYLSFSYFSHYDAVFPYVAATWASAEPVDGLTSPVAYSERLLQWYTLRLINEREMLHPLISFILGHGSGEFPSAADHYTKISGSRGCLPIHKSTDADTHTPHIAQAPGIIRALSENTPLLNYMQSPVVGPDVAIMPSFWQLAQSYCDAAKIE